MSDFIDATELSAKNRRRKGKTIYGSFDPASGLSMELSVKTYERLPVCEWRPLLREQGEKRNRYPDEVKSLSLELPRHSSKETKLLRGERLLSRRGLTIPGNYRSFMPVLDAVERFRDDPVRSQDVNRLAPIPGCLSSTASFLPDGVWSSPRLGRTM